jgi:hypothetical protein
MASVIRSGRRSARPPDSRRRAGTWPRSRASGRTGPNRPWPPGPGYARARWAWRTKCASRPASSDGVLRLQEGVERALGVDHSTPPPGRRTTTSGRGALLGVGRGLLVEIEAVLQARGLQHVAQHLLAPAPLHARPAPQRRRQLARLVLGVDRGLEQQLLDLGFSPPVSSARAFSMAATCSSNLARVSATGLSWPAMRSMARASCERKVSIRKRIRRKVSRWLRRAADASRPPRPQLTPNPPFIAYRPVSSPDRAKTLRHGDKGNGRLRNPASFPARWGRALL